MIQTNNFYTLLCSLIIVLFFAQNIQAQQGGAITISGKVFEKNTNYPLEFATVVFENTTTKQLTGAMVDANGNFIFTAKPGTYNVRFEFLSFTTISYTNQTYTANKDFGTIYLESNVQQLNDIEVVGEKSTVEIKLDKKVYNVGKDMTVKGGTMSDVLDNVPSVTVDSDGTVALRGNENVRILIDGKPSGMAGIDVASALKMLPADSVDKVEVITNPSARYDAEGSGGIINIVLKKGKADGVNGSIIASVGDPESYGLNSSINFRAEKFNLFSNFGYNYRTSKGNSKTDTHYLGEDVNEESIYIDERRNNTRTDKGLNGNFGIEYFLTPSLTWTNSLSFRKSKEENPDNVYFNNFDENRNATFTRNRFNDQNEEDFSIEYATNFTKNFKKEDHKLTVDMAFSSNGEDENSTITDQILNSATAPTLEQTLNNQTQRRNLFQADYVLPIGENGRFEAGYRGSFQHNLTDFLIQENDNGVWVNNTYYSNLLEYNEDVYALYTQYGNKIKKFSYFLGLRWEDSKIDVNSITSNDYNTKKYNNFFPTATLNYEFSETSSFSISYSRRINRPRGRFLNPFSSYSSNINIFQGNPDLNPAYTDAIEIGYLKKWDKLTLNSSAYVNLTDDSFQFIRKESGAFVNGVPVILSTPINLAKEYRAGFEFNANYTPYKWWRLNANFNLFRSQTEGDYTYTNYIGETVVQNFDNTATSWFTRVSSKVTLPYKIDWQTNIFYQAPQTTAQGKSLSMTSINLAFSKDILKDKATVAFNVSDLLNTRKRRSETYIDGVSDSYSEMQWRERQLTLTFTYRFNKKKERERQNREDGGSEGEYM